MNLKSRASRAVQSANRPSMHVQNVSHCDLAALGARRARETRTADNLISPATRRFLFVFCVAGGKRGGAAYIT